VSTWFAGFTNFLLANLYARHSSPLCHVSAMLIYSHFPSMIQLCWYNLQVPWRPIPAWSVPMTVRPCYRPSPRFLYTSPRQSFPRMICPQNKMSLIFCVTKCPQKSGWAVCPHFRKFETFFVWQNILNAISYKFVCFTTILPKPFTKHLKYFVSKHARWQFC
jgi:hypothetical protein